MHTSERKLERLIQVARLYYEEDKNQNDIAGIMGVSRPMISRMLQEAKELGVVHIEVRSPTEQSCFPLGELRRLFPLQGGVVVPDAKNANLTNIAVARAAISFLEGKGIKRLGLGWGSIIGAVVSELETREPQGGMGEQVFPLLGSLGGSNRNYHTNELVRIFAQQTGSSPSYLHAPAFFTTRQELAGYREFESFGEIQRLWNGMDGALINIGNHPASPDFATRARFGNLLDSKKAKGRILSYYYNKNGEIIHSETDYVLQVPLDTLVRCRNVTAICSSNVMPVSLLGALRTGLVDNLIASESLVRETLLLVQE